MSHTTLVVAALIAVVISVAGLVVHFAETPAQRIARQARQAAQLNFYVVNAGWGSSRATHIMRSKSAYIPNANPRDLGNIALSVVTGYVPTAKSTLCGLPAGRYVNAFAPGEAGCRECRRRWEQMRPRSPEEQAMTAAVRASTLAVADSIQAMLRPPDGPPVITGDQAIAAMTAYLAGQQPVVPGLTDAQAVKLAKVMAENAHLPADEFRAALIREGIDIPPDN